MLEGTNLGRRRAFRVAFGMKIVDKKSGRTEEAGLANHGVAG